MKISYYIPQKLGGLSSVIWEQRSESLQSWQILPSGHLELIFNLGDKVQQLSGKHVSNSFNPTENFCFLSGLHTKPLYMTISNFHVMGVQLKPIAVKALFGLPCSELKDWALPAAVLLKNEIEEIETTFHTLPDFIARAQWIENFLVKRLRADSDLTMAIRLHNILQQAVAGRQNDKPIHIEELTGYSRMHNYRLFKTWLGLSPSESISLMQFTEAVRSLHNENHSLTKAALQLGYYDQSHFIRLFKQFAQMTPGQYLRQKTSLPGQLPH